MKFIYLASIVAIAAVNLVIVTTIPSFAKVTINEKTKYYFVKGKSGKGLTRDLLIRGSRANRVRHAVATTAIDLKVQNLRFDRRKSKCRVKSVLVRLRLTYTYPKLRNRKRTSRRLKKNWDSYYSQIVKHEKTHGKIARSFARQAEKDIRKSSTRKTANCRNLTRLLKRKLDRLERKHKRRQIAFDRKEARRSSVISKKAIFLLRTP